MKNDKADPLQELRKIILEEDEGRIVELEKELKTLRASINDTDVWLEKIDPVLLAALSQKVSESKEEVADALAPVMGVAIKTHIQDAKEDMIDALYPVIGSTIRKSIAEAMKKLVKTINEKVDRALSFQLFFGKIKSKITGVSEGELVLKDALPFQMHEIFLIHKKQGGASASPDEEIVSGMLTAIRDFAKTAFEKNGSGELSEVKYEDLQIYLEDGRSAYLAAVVSDFPPDNFSERLRKYENQIHNRFHKQLRDFEGDGAPLAGTSGILKKLLGEFNLQPHQSVETQQNGQSSSPRGLLYLLILALIIVFAYLGLFWFPQWRAEKRILAGINELKEKETVLAGSNLSFDVDGKTVLIDGFINSTTAKNRITTLIQAQPDVEVVENNLKMGLSRDDLDEILRQVETRLTGELSVGLSEQQYILDGDVLTIEGNVASSKEKALIGHELSASPQLRMVINNLSIGEDITIMPVEIRNRIEKTVISFESNSLEIPQQQKLKLQAIAKVLKSYRFGKISVHSHSDAFGNEAPNQALSERRGRVVKDYFVSLGVTPDQVEIVAWGAKKPIATNQTDEGRALNRRVEFILTPVENRTQKED